MKSSLLFSFLLVLILSINFSSSPKGFEEEDDMQTIAGPDGNLVTCGVERWSIKTCIDADTTHVNFGLVVPSTIAYQHSLPIQPTLPPNNRLPLEDTVYRIDCRLARYKLETDGDVHCVIVSGTDTMVSEICDPSCPGISTTSRYPMLTTLRNWFVANFNPQSGWQYPNVPVRLTGVGFFDFQHGQIGIPPNGREIHPILTMTLTTGIEPVSGETPDKFELKQNYPNPFNPSTQIEFSLPTESAVSLVIYDAGGKIVERLVDGEMKKSGNYAVTFNADDLSSGIYFYKLIAGGFEFTKKMVLLK